MTRLQRVAILSTLIPLILTALIAVVSVFFTHQSRGYLSPIPVAEPASGEVKGRQIIAPIPNTPTPIMTDENPEIATTPLITAAPTPTATPTPTPTTTPAPAASTPTQTPTPTPTPTSLNCDTSCVNTVINTLTTSNMANLYNLLSSQLQQDLTLTDFEASATSSASIASTTVSSCSQTAINWCSVDINLTLTDGSSGSYTVILYRENNQWLIYGTN